MRPYALEPSALTHALYLIGFDEGRGRGPHVQGRAHPDRLAHPGDVRPGRRSFDASAELRRAWDIMADEPLETVVLRFAPSVAKRVAETRWHPSQELDAAPDGSLVWRGAVAGVREIRLWILGWGPDVEVLEPAALRADVGGRREALGGPLPDRRLMATRDRFDRFTDRARHVLPSPRTRRSGSTTATSARSTSSSAWSARPMASPCRSSGAWWSISPRFAERVEFIIGGQAIEPAAGEVAADARAPSVSSSCRSTRPVAWATTTSARSTSSSGLVREGEGIAAGVLESLGVNLDKVRHEVIRTLAMRAAELLRQATSRRTS